MLAIGSLNLSLHQAGRDFDVRLNGVNVSQGIAYHRFTLHDLHQRRTTVLDKEGVHVFNRQLIFPRNAHSSPLVATRLPPTAIPMFTGEEYHADRAEPWSHLSMWIRLGKSVSRPALEP